MMTNNKGQALVLFLLLLPAVLLLCAAIIDSSLMVYNKNKIDNINSEVLTSLSTRTNISEADIRNLYDFNDDNIVIDSIEIKDNYIKVKSHKEIEPIFGKLIGFNTYTVKSEKEIKYDKKLYIYFEIKNNKVISHDGNHYKVSDNKINLSNFDIHNKTIEIAFNDVDSTLLSTEDNRLYVYTHNLFINDTFIKTIHGRSIIHIVENKLYLNESYMKDIPTLNGNLFIDITSIKYVKVYDELLDINRIKDNINKNRSWLDEG